LSDITVSSSKKINSIAAVLSRMAVEKYRADSALMYFDAVYVQGQGSRYVDSLSGVYERTKVKQKDLMGQYQQKIQQLTQELEAVEGELRSAVVLKVLCQIEASQAGLAYQDALNNVADNVESIAETIKEQIVFSRQQVAILQ